MPDLRLQRRDRISVLRCLRRSSVLGIFSLLLFTSCQPTAVPRSTVVNISAQELEATFRAMKWTETPSASGTAARMPAATQTLSPSVSPTPSNHETPRPTPWPAGFTPTTRPTPTEGLPPTATRGAPEICPAPTNPSSPLEDFFDMDSYRGQPDAFDPAEYEQSILDFLQANGNVRDYKTQLDAWLVPQYIQVYEEDLTGDGTKDFLISISKYFNGQERAGGGGPIRMAMFFLGCRDGAYVLYQRVIVDDAAAGRYGAHIEAVTDLNADGIKEIFYSFVSNVGSQFTDLSAQVLEWDGTGFRELLMDDPNPGSEWNRFGVEAYAEVTDIDSNGTQELLFPDRVFVNPEGMGVLDCAVGVSRNSNAVWMWDGEYYRYMWREPVAPLYRFQAAFDGDLFTSYGLFDRAEATYLRAVNDSSLKRGSRADWATDWNCGMPPDLKPDVTEPQKIKAYVRLRLVELYAALGSPSKARTQWQYLADNYPPDSPGHLFASLADIFWQEYQKEEDVSAACTAVRNEARANQEGFLALFDGYGFGNPGPSVESVCPFVTAA
jgi:hypothetical protein